MNAAEKLAREIRRVSAIREHYQALDGMPQVNVKLTVAMMDQSLEKACIAAGSGDALLTLAALQDLGEYTDG